MGEEFRKDLEVSFAKARRILSTARAAAKIVRKNGGSVSVEWPKETKGWDEPEMQAFLAECDFLDA